MNNDRKLALEAVDEAKAAILAIAQSSGSDQLDAMASACWQLNTAKSFIEKLDAERLRSEEMASKLRKMWGTAFTAECDEAGIE